MYYSAVPPNGTPGQEKQQGIYVPAPNPFGPAPAGYAPGQPGLPPGLAAAPRYAAGPQAYAVVSTPGHPGFGAGSAMSPAYTSLPYGGFATIPTSSHAYISTGQYPQVGYQTALAQRNAQQSHFSAPVQAGAPLIAAGYTQVPGGGIPTQATRGYPFGAVAGYPAGAAAYSIPNPGGPAPGPYHTPASYEPPF